MRFRQEHENDNIRAAFSPLGVETDATLSDPRVGPPVDLLALNGPSFRKASKQMEYTAFGRSCMGI
jgi:hypothetical protein